MTAAPERVTHGDYLFFEVGEARFCAPVDDVQAIVELNEIHGLPLAPRGVVGTVLFREQIAVVCDLGMVLNVETGGAEQKNLSVVVSLEIGLVAFRVDHVSDIVPGSEVRPQVADRRALKEWMDGYVMRGPHIAFLTTFHKLLKLIGIVQFPELVRGMPQERESAAQAIGAAQPEISTELSGGQAVARVLPQAADSGVKHDSRERLVEPREQYAAESMTGSFAQVRSENLPDGRSELESGAPPAAAAGNANGAKARGAAPVVGGIEVVRSGDAAFDQTRRAPGFAAGTGRDDATVDAHGYDAQFVRNDPPSGGSATGVELSADLRASTLHGGSVPTAAQDSSNVQAAEFEVNAAASELPAERVRTLSDTTSETPDGAASAHYAELVPDSTVPTARDSGDTGTSTIEATWVQVPAEPVQELAGSRGEVSDHDADVDRAEVDSVPITTVYGDSIDGEADEVAAAGTGEPVDTSPDDDRERDILGHALNADPHRIWADGPDAGVAGEAILSGPMHTTAERTETLASTGRGKPGDAEVLPVDTHRARQPDRLAQSEREAAERAAGVGAVSRIALSELRDPRRFAVNDRDAGGSGRAASISKGRSAGRMAAILLVLLLAMAGGWWWFAQSDSVAPRADERKSAPVQAMAPLPAKPPVQRETLPKKIEIVGKEFEMRVDRASQEKGAPQPSLTPRTADETVHVVRRGDTLWEIASRYLGNPYRYPELARSSEIRNPDLIHPGDVVRIRKLR